MAARPGPGPALALFPVLLALLVVAAGAPPGPAKPPRVYLSSWAVRVAAGLRDARDLARRHGLLYLGQVRPGRAQLIPCAPGPILLIPALCGHCLSPWFVSWAGISSIRPGCSELHPTLPLKHVLGIWESCASVPPPSEQRPLSIQG